MHLLDGAPAIKLASNTFHARRARQILYDHAPEVAGRLVRARDYVPFEWGILHAVMVAYEAHRNRASAS